MIDTMLIRVGVCTPPKAEAGSMRYIVWGFSKFARVVWMGGGDEVKGELTHDAAFCP